MKIRPHVSKGKYQGGSSGVDRDGILRIATNLLDVPAEIIAILEAYRWTIEIFYQPPRRLSPVPAPPGLPPPAEPPPERHRDSNLLRDHRLPGHRPLVKALPLR